MYVGTDADDAVRIEIFSGVLAYVRNIPGQFLDTALGVRTSMIYSSGVPT